MIHKDRQQRIEKVFFQIIKQSGRVLQKAAIRDLRIGTRRTRVCLVKALADRSNGSIDGIAIVATTATGTIKGTKEIGTRLSEAGANQRCFQESLSDSDTVSLEIIVTNDPFSQDIDPQSHFFLYTGSAVAESFTCCRRNAFAFVAIYLAVRRTNEKKVRQSRILYKSNNTHTKTTKEIHTCTN